MITYSASNMNKWAKKGYILLYCVLTEYKGTALYKIGIASSASFLGRYAWNVYTNDGYHKAGFRHKQIFTDEADTIKIDQAVDILEIVDEVQIQMSRPSIKELEDLIRSKGISYQFPSELKFSGKTEYIIVDPSTKEMIESTFTNIRKNLICN